MGRKKGDIKPQSPESLGGLIRLLISGMLRNFKKSFFRVLLLVVAIWAIHTYLLVAVNEGFSDSGTIISSILALRGSEISGTISWTLLTFLAASVLMMMKKFGISGFFTRFGRIPRCISESKNEAPGEALPLLAAGAAITLLIGWLVDNQTISLLLAVLFVFALAVREESLLLFSYRLGYSDIKRRFYGAGGFSPLEIGRTYLCVAGSCAGFVLVAYIPSDAAVVLAIASIVYALWWYHGKGRRGGNVKKAALNYGILVLIAAMALIVVPAAADDGGWAEAGGTFEGWITSEGAAVAVEMGVPPSCGAAIGALAAASTGSIAGLATGTAGTGTGTVSREAQETFRKLTSIEMEYQQKVGAHSEWQDMWSGRAIRVYEGTVTLADLSIDLLANFTGGLGKGIKYSYTAVKTFGVSVAEGRGVGESLGRTVVSTGVDFVADKVGDKVGGAIVNRMPSAKGVLTVTGDYSGAVGNLGNPVKTIVKDTGKAIANTGLGKVQGTLILDPLKTGLVSGGKYQPNYGIKGRELLK